MTERRKYRKKAGSNVVAVQLTLSTTGFTYEKWGSTQTCKPGDWIVDNNGDVYSIDQETFARTYRPVGPGQYAKIASVWAEAAHADGAVNTKEGITHYRAGDFLVYNEPDGGDGYAVDAAEFRRMYEADDAR